jgi:hypothetical protein
MTEQNMIQLKSVDGKVFEVSFKVATMSQMIKDTLSWNDDEGEIEDEDREVSIPANVSGECLKKVVDFCEYYQKEPMIKFDFKDGKQDLKGVVTQEWYRTFIQGFSNEELFAMIQAANFLNIESLLCLSILGISCVINNKSEGNVRTIFNIPRPNGAETNVES